jgi:hypothetical protein
LIGLEIRLGHFECSRTGLLHVFTTERHKALGRSLIDDDVEPVDGTCPVAAGLQHEVDAVLGQRVAAIRRPALVNRGKKARVDAVFVPVISEPCLLPGFG